MQDKYTLEACVDSLESALAAKEGGANRLELCGNIVIGGTTPSLALFREVKKRTGLRTHVLIRPRFGDFCYTDNEFRIMCDEIELFKSEGADGVVYGCLDSDGNLDVSRMEKLRECAGDMYVTMHRAFDVCAEPFLTMEQAYKTGVNGILTSCRKNTSIEALDFLCELLARAEGKIDILLGGISESEQIEQILRRVKVNRFHLSGHEILDSPMKLRTDIKMGAPGIGEFEIYRTAACNIKRAKDIIESNIK